MMCFRRKCNFGALFPFAPIESRTKLTRLTRLKQNAEYAPTINTCVPILKYKIPNKFAKVSLTGTGLRSSTWRSRMLETPTLTALKNIENNRERQV